MRLQTIGRRIFFLGVLFGSAVSAFGMDLSWNGFGSVYYGQALSADLQPYGFENDHVNFRNFSLIGLNLGAQVNDDLDFAAQFVALGTPVGTTDSFGEMAQWAFLKYEPVSGTSIRAGRQLYPTLLASEYVRVGFLLPFRQIPYETVGIAPFTRFDGVSVSHEIPTSFGKLTLGVFGGTPLLDIGSVAAFGLAFQLSDLVGAKVSLDGDGWRIHAQASRFFSELTMSAPLAPAYLHGHTQDYSIGYRYDRSRLVSWGEFTFSQTPDGSPVNGGKYVGHGHGFYWLGGYRVGKFMPRYTFAQQENVFNILTGTGYANGKTTTHTIGVNYEAGGQAILKVEYEQVVIPRPLEGSYFVNQSSTSTSKSAGALYAGLDFIF